MLIMTMKKCVHVHLRGGFTGRVEGFAHPRSKMTCGFLIQLVFCEKRKNWWFIGAEVKHETRLENLR